METEHQNKFIFVTGGVVSSLGKGLVAASVGALLETRGLRVTLIKADPYLNVDPGTMNPRQHGEVFVTHDGAETDLDLGHYERFTNAVMQAGNSFSTGRVYDAVISKERRGDYLGGTVQVVPHITDEICRRIFAPVGDADIAIVEIGGTVGDIESLPFLEAIRQIRSEHGSDNVLFVHVTLVPWLEAAQELKTKPTQHSVKSLRQTGIQPDVLICRAARTIPQRVLQKISLTCDVPPQAAIQAQDLDSIYKLPLHFSQQRLDQVIVDKLKIWTRRPDLSAWQKISDSLDAPHGECRIGIVGKYVDVIDSYKSVHEALVHAGIDTHLKIVVSYIDAEQLEQGDIDATLRELQGIIVPGGFGQRGIEGKIQAISYCRRRRVPFLGICYGMQLAAIEFARHELGLRAASSAEFDDDVQDFVVDLRPEQRHTDDKGGTMRLGAHPCKLQHDSRVYEIYGQETITERHRHRFEFNNSFRERFEQHGMRCSGLSPDAELVEMMELTEHPWFICCQFHPELQSSPRRAHPLFCSFVSAAYAC